MKFTTSIIPIVTGSFVLAALLVFACTETSQLDSEALTTEISELSADKNHALPPVTGDPAFIWSIDDPDIQWGPCPEFFPDGCELAILQGDPAQDNADALLRLTPGSTVPMHWHTSAERMILLSGEFRVNFQGQAPVVIGEFDYAYGPAKLPHDARCMEQEDDCLLFIAFEEPVDAVDVRGGNLPHRR
jgi:quercetin dioxygenase-like cupin family protein